MILWHYFYIFLTFENCFCLFLDQFLENFIFLYQKKGLFGAKFLKKMLFFLKLSSLFQNYVLGLSFNAKVISIFHFVNKINAILIICFFNFLWDFNLKKVLSKNMKFWKIWAQIREKSSYKAIKQEKQSKTFYLMIIQRCICILFFNF